MDYNNAPRIKYYSAEKKNFSKVGAIYGVMLLTITAMQLGIGLLFKTCCPELLETHFWLYFLVVMSPTYIIGYPIIKGFMGKLESFPIEKRKLRAGDFFVFFCMAECLLVAGSILGNVINFILSRAVGYQSLDNLDEVIQRSNPYVNLFIAGICAPVFEELMFRKLLINNLIKYGEGLAIVVSGIAFGLYHGNFSQFFYAAFVGILFGYVYCKTGNIKYTIFLHMIINTMSVIISPLAVKLQQVLINTLKDFDGAVASGEWLFDALLPTMLIILYESVVLIFVVIGLVNLISKRKRFTFMPGQITIQRGYRFKTVVGNPGAITFIVICLSIFVYSMFL